MRIFKFGGASVKDAEAVRNVARVIGHFPEDELLLVFSAMGKITNTLEAVWEAYCAGGPTEELIDIPRDFHSELVDQLFNAEDPIRGEVQQLFKILSDRLQVQVSEDQDREYDRIVNFGEIVSTKIVSAYLEKVGVENKWLDARTVICTDSTWRNAKVDWQKSAEVLKSFIPGKRITITQGFIGGTSGAATTTLGREGSDFSAAIFAYLLDAESVTIWKDVPGMFNADPNKFEDTVLLPNISYREAIELSYFGASVIHPKTIKPLQNKNIPLYVRSFEDLEAPGSTIHSDGSADALMPSFIFKPDQMLISITPRDFSFIVESHLSEIFNAFDKARVTIGLMQNSALNFSVCVDASEKVKILIDQLKVDFEVRYNEGLELVTVRHYDEATLEKLIAGRELILEQRSRQTARMVLR